jgi:hypothetical protein
VILGRIERPVNVDGLEMRSTPGAPARMNYPGTVILGDRRNKGKRASCSLATGHSTAEIMDYGTIGCISAIPVEMKAGSVSMRKIWVGDIK